jgi:hypothetical protein
MSENNIAINGNEARILMAAIRTSDVSAPIGATLDLYLRLAAISQVQPPQQSMETA